MTLTKSEGMIMKGSSSLENVRQGWKGIVHEIQTVLDQMVKSRVSLWLKPENSQSS